MWKINTVQQRVIGSQPHINTADIDQFPEACILNILKAMEIEQHGMHIYCINFDLMNYFFSKKYFLAYLRQLSPKEFFGYETVTHQDYTGKQGEIIE